jgi:hypothetical protein
LPRPTANPNKYLCGNAKIGEGSFGSVQKCTNIETGTSVIVKSINPESQQLRETLLELKVSVMYLIGRVLLNILKLLIVS